MLQMIADVTGVVGGRNGKEAASAERKRSGTVVVVKVVKRMDKTADGTVAETARSREYFVVL